jgi:hypothetical protein
MSDCVCGNRVGGAVTSRREFLIRSGMGFGALGLASLLSEDILAAAGQARQPHFAARASRVIHIFAAGAPSQVDTWDPKPALAKLDGKPLPGLNGVALASPYKFSKQGQSGIDVSEVFPALGAHVDKMAVIRSLQTDIPAHDVATVMMNTGSARTIKPSLGSWVLYGLGSANENMPGFI